MYQASALSTSRVAAQRCFAPARPAAVRPRRGVAVSAELQPGSKVRVVKPVTVFAGKFKDGLNLEGMEGEAVENVALFKGEVLSANLPWKVRFDPAGPDGKPVKVIVHLVRRGVLERAGALGAQSTGTTEPRLWSPPPLAPALREAPARAGVAAAGRRGQLRSACCC